MDSRPESFYLLHLYPERMRENFWDRICMVLPLWKAAFSVVTAMILLSLFALPFIETESQSYYIFQINVILIAPLMGITLLVLYQCSHRSR